MAIVAEKMSLGLQLTIMLCGTVFVRYILVVA